MGRVFQTLMGVGAIVLLAGVGISQAQPDSSETPLVGDFRTQAASMLSDALMLNAETTEKVVSVYQEIGEKRREEFQGVDFQSMGDEERRKFFDESQKKTIEGMKSGLKEILKEKDLNEVEAIMKVRAFSPIPELRGLRLIELKDEQRAKIQPLSIALAKKVVPPAFGFFGAQMDEAEREKAQKALEDEKAAFLPKVKEILSEEQNKAWQEKIDAINKELEIVRERMRNFQRQ